jgi:hypothetical protein
MIERATVAVLCRPVRVQRKTFIAGTLLSAIVMFVTASAQSLAKPTQTIRQRLRRPAVEKPDHRQHPLLRARRKRPRGRGQSELSRPSEG